MGRIVLDHVSKHFGELQVLKDICLEIEDGEFVFFVGPSGCGKSTLLRSITGLEDITSGQVLIDGEDVSDLPPSERGLAMVFQSYALFPHITVRDNIAFGLKIAKIPKAEIDAKVAEAARILSLEELLDRKPAALSGGQRQRVAIGRAIVRDPKAFLFDEPLSNLDAALRVQMRVELIGLRKSLQTTMVYVTHDQIEAMTMADRIAVLNAGQVEQYDTPLELYDHPENLFVATFIGSPKMNILDIEGHDPSTLNLAGGQVLDLPGSPGFQEQRPACLGIRPEHMTCSKNTGLWEGEVVLEEQLGSDAFLYVDVPGLSRFTVRGVGQRGIREGDKVHVTPDTEHCHVFDRDGRRIETVDRAADVDA
ncbi:MAG: sn-glycerol-3-phosphate ABC transporter ATP-binding protein UgpC [Rhodospirillaceae bacterium]|nr:sn-glycerol-3-phosphate ABC transporter ATP-binding protein UgpC [Rhodospirillaceae bacterium]